MGLRLRRNLEPVWVNLYDGARLLADAPSTALVYAARARAAALITDLLASGEAVTKVGAHITGLPDLASPAEIDATTNAVFALSLAEIAVTDWANILDDDGNALAFKPALLVHLLADPKAADAFLSNYLHPLNEVVAEGNA